MVRFFPFLSWLHFVCVSSVVCERENQSQKKEHPFKPW
jgi:hypothetical protein